MSEEPNTQPNTRCFYIVEWNNRHQGAGWVPCGGQFFAVEYAFAELAHLRREDARVGNYGMLYRVVKRTIIDEVQTVPEESAHLKDATSSTAPEQYPILKVTS